MASVRHEIAEILVAPCVPKVVNLDHLGTAPDGYHVITSRTDGNLFFFRGFLVEGNPRPAVENIKQHYRAYPLAQALQPPSMHFVNWSEQDFLGIPPCDASFYESVAAIVHDEPLEAVDPETRGLLAAIGIQKGKPFAPDARMQHILAEAAAVGDATQRTLTYQTHDRNAYLYPDRTWQSFWTSGWDFSQDGVLNLDARTRLFSYGWGTSPAMTVKMVGAGSQYGITFFDSTGRYLDGGQSYRLHLPPHILAKDFWSVLVYDTQTRSMLQTDQPFPSLGSQKAGILINPDTSVDIYFGPEPPPGKENNWVQTIPGKGWWIILRLYGPLEPWFDKSWRPGEIERID